MFKKSSSLSVLWLLNKLLTIDLEWSRNTSECSLNVPYIHTVTPRSLLPPECLDFPNSHTLAFLSWILLGSCGFVPKDCWYNHNGCLVLIRHTENLLNTFSTVSFLNLYNLIFYNDNDCTIWWDPGKDWFPFEFSSCQGFILSSVILREFFLVTVILLLMDLPLNIHLDLPFNMFSFHTRLVLYHLHYL